MTEIEFAALLVSRVCHDLVGPLGAVVNGMEVLEDERDPAMRADAIKLVTMSADQALARIQFMRIAFGAAGSAGAELDLSEIGRLVAGLLARGSIVGVIAAALLFGFLRSGGINMEMVAGVPTALVMVIQGLIVVMLAGASFFIGRRT